MSNGSNSDSSGESSYESIKGSLNSTIINISSENNSLEVSGSKVDLNAHQDPFHIDLSAVNLATSTPPENSNPSQNPNRQRKRSIFSPNSSIIETNNENSVIKNTQLFKMANTTTETQVPGVGDGQTITPQDNNHNNNTGLLHNSNNNLNNLQIVTKFSFQSALNLIPEISNPNPNELDRFFKVAEFALKNVEDLSRGLLLDALVTTKVSGKAHTFIKFKQIVSLDHLKILLQDNFCPKFNLPHLQTKLNSLKQYSHEKVVNFANRLQNTLHELVAVSTQNKSAENSLIIEDMLQQQALNIFVMGLVPDLRLIIRARNPQSLQIAISEAINEETFQNHDNTNIHAPNVQNVKKQANFNRNYQGGNQGNYRQNFSQQNNYNKNYSKSNQQNSNNNNYSPQNDRKNSQQQMSNNRATVQPQPSTSYGPVYNKNQNSNMNRNSKMYVMCAFCHEKNHHISVCPHPDCRISKQNRESKKTPDNNKNPEPKAPNANQKN